MTGVVSSYGTEKQWGAVKFIESALGVSYAGSCYDDLSGFIGKYLLEAKRVKESASDNVGELDDNEYHDPYGSVDRFGICGDMG